MADADAAYKRLFSHPRMVEDLLRGFVPGDWADTLDFTTLEKLPAEFVSDGLRLRQGDAMWRIRVRDRWLYVLVLLEFQSTVDPWMAVRILVYTGLLYQDLIRWGELGPNGTLPPVLPIVLYNGRARWTAKVDVAALIAPVGEALARYQPSQRHLVLDEGSYGEEDLPQRNLVSALMRLEQSRTLADVGRVVDVLLEWLGDERHRELKGAFGEWIQRVLRPRWFASAELSSMPSLEEVRTMLAERVQEWYDEARDKGLKDGREEGLREGLKEGLKEGREEGRAEERALLRRLAARKFDAETAEQLSEVLDRLETAEQFAEIGERIIECETGADLLERTRRLVRR